MRKEITMEHAEEMLKLYHNIEIFCGTAAGILLAVSATLFVRFRIPQIWKKRRWIFLWLCLVVSQGVYQGQKVQAAQRQDTEAPEEVAVPEDTEIPEDNENPQVKVTWKNEQGESLEGLYQTGSEIFMDLEIQEENLDEEATQIFLEACGEDNTPLSIKEASQLNGKNWKELREERKTDAFDMEESAEDSDEPVERCWEIQEETGRYCLRIILQSEAHYHIYAKIQDLSGNIPEESGENGYLDLGSFCLDRTAPVLLEESGITLEAEHQTFLEKLIQQVTFGCFCQPVLTVQIRAFDAVAGVEGITYICEGIGGEEESESVRLEETVVQGASVSFSLPTSFQGTIRAKAWDRAGNQMEEWTESTGILVESETMHRKSSCLKVILTEEAETEEAEGKEYFCREDVSLIFRMKDTFSGIRSYHIQAGTQEETRNFEETGTEIETELEETLLIPAARNNRNNIPITAEFTDFAGHRTEPLKLPVVHIDTEPPQIEVEWLNQDVRNEKYYQAPQTARIAVRERNFVPDRVQLEITGLEQAGIKETDLVWTHQAGEGCEGSSAPSDRNHSDNCVWVSELIFEEDGAYTFGCSCQDAAGNTGTYGKTDTFVVDRTPPVLKVQWDASKPQNERYYSQMRSAVVEINEKNFRPEDLETLVDASNEGQAITPPSMGELRQWEEDIWRAGVTFEEDGRFGMEITCVDLAGNEAVPYICEEFIIDRTPPELVFENVADHSANQGAVAPELKVRDVNFDPEQTEVSFTGSSGTGQIPAYARSSEENGFTLLWGDFEHLPENDDLYRIKAIAGDLAGNTAEAELTFSVNRFGSVYELDEATARLAGPGGIRYAAAEPELVVTEYNPDYLDYYQITCNREGETVELQKDRDYQVETAGTKDTWKTYRYRIGKKNFEKEGIYLVTLYSKDRAKNVSNNRIKEKSLEFIVDKTGPGIVINGVKDKERIRGNSLEIQTDLWDSYPLKRAEIYVNGTCVSVYDAKRLKEAEGSLRSHVSGSKIWQTFLVKAWDQAGNLTEAGPVRFLVTEEASFRITENPAGKIAVLLFMAVLLTICFFLRNKSLRDKI